MRPCFAVLALLCLLASSSFAAEEYIIRSGDTLDVTVDGEPTLTKRTVVRPDGKVAIGLIGDVQAAGRTPEQFRASVEKGLKKYIRRPKVSVEVTGYDTAASVNVLGAVRVPGHYPLKGRTTVTDALALAGGTTPDAKLAEITVVRECATGTDKSCVDLKKMIQTGETKENLVLQSGDTVFVPARRSRTDWVRVLGTAVSIGYFLRR